MILIVYELFTTQYQSITVGTHDIQLAAVRPHLIRYASPAGNLQMKIYDANGGYVAASDVVAASAVGSGAYWHGYQRFLITAQLKANTTYRMQLEASGGYAFAETAYIGWCNDYDLRKVPALFTPNDGISAPLDIEFWEYVDAWRRAG